MEIHLLDRRWKLHYPVSGASSFIKNVALSLNTIHQALPFSLDPGRNDLLGHLLTGI